MPAAWESRHLYGNRWTEWESVYEHVAISQIAPHVEKILEKISIDELIEAVYRGDTFGITDPFAKSDRAEYRMVVPTPREETTC